MMDRPPWILLPLRGVAGMLSRSLSILQRVILKHNFRQIIIFENNVYFNINMLTKTLFILVVILFSYS